MRWEAPRRRGMDRAMTTVPAIAAPLGWFALFWLAQVATPGPNFVRISHTALAASRAAAFATACGTAIGNGIWCLVAALGAAALVGDGLVGQLVRGLGALYLATFGARLLTGAVRRRGVSAAPPAWLPDRAGAAAVRLGLVTALTNPQAIIFFATILLATLPASRPVLLVAALVVVPAVTLLWYAVVIGLLSAPRPRGAYERVRPLVDAGFGFVLLATALRLARQAVG